MGPYPMSGPGYTDINNPPPQKAEYITPSSLSPITLNTFSAELPSFNSNTLGACSIEMLETRTGWDSFTVSRPLDPVGTRGNAIQSSIPYRNCLGHPVL